MGRGRVHGSASTLQEKAGTGVTGGQGGLGCEDRELQEGAAAGETVAKGS